MNVSDLEPRVSALERMLETLNISRSAGDSTYGNNLFGGDPAGAFDRNTQYQFELPTGIIAMWSGTTPPDGWKLCDGTDGTPDLKGRFIVGYDSGDTDYDNPGDLSQYTGTTAGETGGTKFIGTGTSEDTSVPRPINLKHTHSLCISTCIVGVGSGGGCISYVSCVSMLDCADSCISWCSTSSPETTDDMTSDVYEPSQADNRPPYYVLAFIMKC